MSKKSIVALLAVILVASVFMVALPSIASESLNTSSTAEPPLKIEGLQQRIYSQGYNYTVAENWITALSTEDSQQLCGYKPLKPPTESLPGNIEFWTVDEIPKSKLVTQSLDEAPPSSYDAMALGYVTPVKDQGGCGSCWIFAAIADFESDVLINESLAVDFSEQEVGDCNIWSSVGGYNFCDGGDYFMTTNYLTKHGSADEACHPYAATQQTCHNCSLLKNVNNWRMITGSNGESQIMLIKNAILRYGPVHSTIYASDPGFSAYNGGVYEYWGSGEPDHAIEIIGWDDSLPHSHGTGAWLIKNSWGTGWGANGPYPGCAWVAYGAANIGDSTSAIASYKNPDEVIFYHDECGWMGYVMGCGRPTAYGAVWFVPLQDVKLTAVDFWAIDTQMAYEIKIFDRLTDLGDGKYTFSDQLGTTKTGTTNELGYYSIPLDRPVQLEEGNDFIVQVKLTTTRYGYPIPIDYYTDSDLPPWSDIATFSGESYFSCYGSQFVKPYNSYSGEYYDIGIRARAEAPNQPPQAIIDSIAPNPAEWVIDTVSFVGHGTDNDGTIVGYNWSSSIDGPLSTAPSFTKPASELSIGTHLISFKVQDDKGAWSTEATENLTINPVNPTRVFYTDKGTYPSISGIHNGTITPSYDINVSRMYTYPCAGTGGHSEYVHIWGDSVDKSASWTGYSGDWHNITFDSPFVLEAGHTYNYEIRTGSYPQIIHESPFDATGGTITCDKFTDANGKEYNNWIPAIRLWAE